MTAVVHTGLLTARLLRAFVRMPVYLFMNLVQPMMWLLLFGALFSDVVRLPGFSDTSYLEFLTPGVVMMMTLFGSAWAGTAFVEDMSRGVMDRFLASPTSRSALMVATMAYQSVLAVLQTLVVLGVAWLAGARPGGGVSGVLLLLLGVVLLTSALSAMSNAVALLAGTQEALIGISQLVSLPLMFVSSAIMDTRLAPSWVGEVARFNPFEWAVVVGRQALSDTRDPALLWGHAGLLAALAVVVATLATLAFRARQKAA